MFWFVFFISASLLSEPLLHSWQAPEMDNQCVAVPDFADIATFFPKLQRPSLALLVYVNYSELPEDLGSVYRPDRLPAFQCFKSFHLSEIL